MPLEEFQDDDHLGYQNKIQNEFTILNLHVALNDASNQQS